MARGGEKRIHWISELDWLGKKRENTVLTSRPVTGTLKGYDALMNLVLDDVEELLQGKHVQLFPRPETNAQTDGEGNTSSRTLGLVVARGTLLVLVSPCDGSEEIPNPFLAPQADD